MPLSCPNIDGRVKEFRSEGGLNVPYRFAFDLGRNDPTGGAATADHPSLCGISFALAEATRFGTRASMHQGAPFWHLGGRCARRPPSMSAPFPEARMRERRACGPRLCAAELPRCTRSSSAIACGWGRRTGAGNPDLRIGAEPAPRRKHGAQAPESLPATHPNATPFARWMPRAPRSRRARELQRRRRFQCARDPALLAALHPGAFSQVFSRRRRDDRRQEDNAACPRRSRDSRLIGYPLPRTRAGVAAQGMPRRPLQPGPGPWPPDFHA